MLRSLQGTVDFYKCLHIKNQTLPENFSEVLGTSISEWLEQKIKGVWLLVPNSQIELTAVCRDHGFYPHHVNDKGVMMAKWLKDRENTLPSYSTHYIGVGGVLFDSQDRVLLVKNRYSGIGVINWRVPGGLVNAGELIVDAAVREVLEETSIQSRPIGVMSFREKMNYQFDRPDIYYLVLLEPLTFEYKIDPIEITECEWMDFRQWIAEDLPGDARKMLKTMYADTNAPLVPWFSSLCMNYCQFEYNTPNYNATHYYHISSSK